MYTLSCLSWHVLHSPRERTFTSFFSSLLFPLQIYQMWILEKSMSCTQTTYYPSHACNLHLLSTFFYYLLHSHVSTHSPTCTKKIPFANSLQIWLRLSDNRRRRRVVDAALQFFTLCTYPHNIITLIWFLLPITKTKLLIFSKYKKKCSLTFRNLTSSLFSGSASRLIAEGGIHLSLVLDWERISSLQSQKNN